MVKCSTFAVKESTLKLREVFKDKITVWSFQLIHCRVISENNDTQRLKHQCDFSDIKLLF